MELHKTWMGAGLKVGGILFTVGVESIEGHLFNLSVPQDNCGFGILNMKVGAGLGASGGIVLCFVFNCLNIQALNGRQVRDWAVSLSTGAKISNALRNSKEVSKALKTLKKLREAKAVGNLTVETLETMKEIASLAYSASELKDTGQLVIIDLPGTGVGLEVSAHISQGKIEIR